MARNFLSRKSRLILHLCARRRLARADMEGIVIGGVEVHAEDGAGARAERGMMLRIECTLATDMAEQPVIGKGEAWYQ